MTPMKGIKKWFAKKALAKKKPDDRMKQVVNFHGAKKVGMLFESTSEHFFVLIKQYVAYLREEHGIAQVMALGYVPDKTEPHYHRHQLNFDYFTMKDLDWKGLPDCDAARNFCETDHDILIDFTKGDCIPLKSVLLDSKAHFKVGRKGDFEESYDLIIQIEDNATFDSYASQVNYFLTSINHHDEKQRV